MEERQLIRLARMTSSLFNPFIIPFGGFIALFLFSYLRIMPLQYKLIVGAIVYCFTILMPTLTIFLYRKANSWEAEDLHVRQKRIVPYLLTIIAYVFCLLMMYKLGLPRYMSGIIRAALAAMSICFLLNFRWKVSAHMAGAGGIVGSLVAFGLLFNYNTVWWFCLFMLTAGALGTSRMILKRHTLGQVIAGFVIGNICALYGILS